MKYSLCAVAALMLASSTATAAISITDNTISWPDDGWYQVQTADTYESVCEGTTSCEVLSGEYIVTNHTTGERYLNVFVGLKNDPNSPIQVSGNIISWPEDGWYQVQRADTNESICSGGLLCNAPNGVYNVTNHTTGETFPNILVDHNPSDPNLKAFEIVGRGDLGNRDELNFLLPLYLHIRSARDLDNLYNVLLIDTSCPACSIPPEIPVIDFETSTLVFVARNLGSGGASFGIERASEESNQLLVDVEKTRFGLNCVWPAVVSGPYHLYKIEGKHDNVMFNEILRVRDC